ncbi:MAG: alpha/beta hydrolase-fold protein [Candidatus Eisenbacteria bacterium]
MADALGGGGRAFTIDSEILGESREVLLGLPASFDSGSPTCRYPVLLTFDGDYDFSPVLATARYLAEAGQIPEAIVVGVSNPDRIHDLTPPGLSVSGSSLAEGGDRVLDFLERELLPALGAQFRAGVPHVLIGHSSGAVLATYAAATRPATFPFTVALDAPTHLQNGWLAERLIEAAQKSSRAGAGSPGIRYLSIESRFGWSQDAWSELVAAAPVSWMLERRSLDHESHQSMVFLGVYLGLRSVFADYSILSAPASPTSATIEHYQTLATVYGAEPIPPRVLLVRAVDDLIIEGERDLAGRTLASLEDSYGKSPATEAIAARLAAARSRPPLAETVKDLLATPKPSPREMAAFLGDWEGQTQTEGGAPPSRLRVRFFETDGATTGEVISWPAPGVEDVQPVTYLRLVDGGLQFGYLNGMRPRGVLVYEATGDSQRLTGTMEIRGVDFQLPGGRSMPTVRFSLTRTRAG